MPMLSLFPKAKAFGLALLLLALGTACNQNQGPDGSLVDKNSSDTLQIPEVFEDSLKLQLGDIPKGWHEVKLGDKGFYVAFPSKPQTAVHPKERRLEWKIRQSKYAMMMSVSDLRQEPSFTQFASNRRNYYDALIKDLIKDLDLPNIHLELSQREYFYFLDVYEAMQATVRADDFKLFVRMVIVDTDLFTSTFVLWADETPALLQLKDRFFYSFSADNYIPKSQQQPTNPQ
jgi:hypothetical protein